VGVDGDVLGDASGNVDRDELGLKVREALARIIFRC
jgi:hypothetical protein